MTWQGWLGWTMAGILFVVVCWQAREIRRINDAWFAETQALRNRTHEWLSSLETTLGIRRD